MNTRHLPWKSFLAACVSFALILALAPVPADAKRQPVVTASFEGAPDTVQLGATVDLVLRLTASTDAPDVHAEVLAPPGVQITAGLTQWFGSLSAAQVVDIPIWVRFIGVGEYTLGARVTSRTGAETQISGTTLSVTTAGSTAELSRQDPFLAKLSRAATADELAAIGVAAPAPGPALGDGLLAVSGSVGGTVRWTDPEGHAHPVRNALVQIFDGAAGGTVLANAVTDSAGAYSAAVNAASNQVSVRAYSRDAAGTIVQVSPPGQASTFYTLTIGPVALTANLTLDLTTPRPARGTPGSPDPTPNTVQIRGFAVYDAMLTYWHQASVLLGRSMPTAFTSFPEPTAGGTCNTSCFSSSQQRMFILRDDAYDWDVLGHEFFHFTTNVFSQSGRSIDNNPGGSHSGGTAIGQNGRNRDAGMRLAWSEGLATFMSLALQKQPLPSPVPFATDLLNVANDSYEDTEDSTLTIAPDNPAPNQGFGSENSVLAVLWDLIDATQDADPPVSDGLSGANAQLLWNAITAGLPCDPCNRADRFWSAIATILGPLNPVVFEVSKLFVLNKMAPKATAPAAGGAFGGGVPPTFQWIANGDPSASHRNNTFFLVFSRDNFVNHIFVLSAPLGAASYQPTEAEWLQLQQGGSADDIYRWFVAGQASAVDAGNPQVPEGLPWFSNVLSFTIRSIHFRITWSPLDTDVDLHFRPPSGAAFSGSGFPGDIAYYNRTPGWGVLDRDCISTCTEENISLIRFPETGTYRAFAHYFSDHGHGPASVRAQAFVGGVLVLDETFALSGTGAIRDVFSVVLTATKPGAPTDIRIVPGDGVERDDGGGPRPPKTGR